MINIYLDEVVEKIKCNELELTEFVNEVKKQGIEEDLLAFIRARLMDKCYIKERSIYCNMIREFNDRKSLPLLWRLLSQDDTKGRRGSLIFAMENMNPIDNLEQLVELVINDNFEVMCNSLDIINNLEGYVNGETIELCISKLKCALRYKIPNWRRDALETLLEEFGGE